MNFRKIALIATLALASCQWQQQFKTETDFQTQRDESNKIRQEILAEFYQKISGSWNNCVQSSFASTKTVLYFYGVGVGDKSTLTFSNSDCSSTPLSNKTTTFSYSIDGYGREEGQGDLLYYVRFVFPDKEVYQLVRFKDDEVIFKVQENEISYKRTKL